MAGMASAGQTTATDAAPGVNSEGLIGLDVVVVDATGQPVSGLRRDDFAVLDDGIPRPVVSFSAHDEDSAKSDSQVQLILLVDTFGETDEVAEQERSATEKFLREHNGQLEMPTTVYALAGLKFWRVAGPSLDGAALASALGQNRMAGDNLLSGGAFAGSMGVGMGQQFTHRTQISVFLRWDGLRRRPARNPGGRCCCGWGLDSEPAQEKIRSIRESIRRISFYRSDGTRQSFARRGLR
jgi:hypothetical protein